MALDIVKLIFVFMVCCYPALAFEKSKNQVEFTATYPKEMQVLRHEDVKIKCPELGGVPRDAKVLYFYRFQKNGPGQNEAFINESQGQYLINTSTGDLTIKEFDTQNEGRYACAALVSTIEGRVIMSSTFRLVAGEKIESIEQDNSLIEVNQEDQRILMYPISPPMARFDSSTSPPLLVVSWNTLPIHEADSSEKIENYVSFVIQMKHYSSFFEDWHNLTQLDNSRFGSQTYTTSLVNYEAGSGKYRILGMTASGRMQLSPLSDELWIPGDETSAHPGHAGIDEHGETPTPVITGATALSENSVLLEWDVSPPYAAAKISSFVVAYSKVQVQSHANHAMMSPVDAHQRGGSWEQDVHLSAPSTRSYIVQSLVANTQYQFRVQAVGTDGSITYSKPKFSSTSLSTWPPPMVVPRNTAEEKDNSLLLVLVIGGCCSLVLIAIIVSVSVLVVYKQRLNNNINSKVMMREMEEEMKRRESSLRKSVGGAIYHQVAAAIQHQQPSSGTQTPIQTSAQQLSHSQSHQMHPGGQLASMSPPLNCPSSSLMSSSPSVQMQHHHLLVQQSQSHSPAPMGGAELSPSTAMMGGVNAQITNYTPSTSPSHTSSPTVRSSGPFGWGFGRRQSSSASNSSPLNSNTNTNARYLLPSTSSNAYMTGGVHASTVPSHLGLISNKLDPNFVNNPATNTAALFVQPAGGYDYPGSGVLAEHQLLDGSDSTSPLHSYQSSNVTALSSLPDTFGPLNTIKPRQTSSPPLHSATPYLGAAGDETLTNESGSLSASFKQKQGAGSTAVEHQHYPSTSCCHDQQQPCYCHQSCSSTHTNIEQGSLLGSGCSEHSVNSSPIQMDDSINQPHLQSLHHNHPPPSSVAHSRQTSATPPMLQSLPSGAFTSAIPRAQPNIYDYSSSPNAMMNPHSIYNTNALYNEALMNSATSSFHPIAEIRGSIVNQSHFPSPTTTTVALPQPLKTLHSPALLAKYTSGGGGGLPHQNTYHGDTEFASFKNLKDLTGNQFPFSTLSRANKNNPAPKTSTASASMLHRNSICNYTIDEDDMSKNNTALSNYQALPSGGEQHSNSEQSQG